jgi:uncharacterized protein YjaG (DUF416 family)
MTAEEPEFFFELDPFLAKLHGQLSGLSVERQVAFGVYCAARLLPMYESYADPRGIADGPVLRRVVDRLWQHVLGKRLSEADAASLYADAEEIELGEDDSGLEWGAALDALDAVSEALAACVGNSAEKATMAAHHVANVVDQRLSRELGTDSAVALDDSLEQVADHPDMQRVHRELLDVVTYLAEAQAVSPSVVAHLKWNATRRN